MSNIYITGNKEKLCIESNHLCIKDEGIEKNIFPIETVEEISVIGNAQLTTQCIKACMEKGIKIIYYTEYGQLCGMVQPMKHIHIELERKQVLLGDKEFAHILGRNILKAKLHNQWVYLNRMSRKKNIDISQELKQIRNSENKLEIAGDLSQMMGYEGIAARHYFQGLSKLLPAEFQFPKRSKRPPKDSFNAMLSYGYAIVMGEIYGKLQERGLNPYFGFIHKDKSHHAALASDLIEEWRTVLVDSMVYSLVSEKWISINEFEKMDDGGIYIKSEGKKIFFRKFEQKMNMETKYLSYLEFSVDFRKAIEFQIASLIKALQSENPYLYNPIRIR